MQLQHHACLSRGIVWHDSQTTSMQNMYENGRPIFVFFLNVLTFWSNWDYNYYELTRNWYDAKMTAKFDFSITTVLSQYNFKSYRRSTGSFLNRAARRYHISLFFFCLGCLCIFIIGYIFYLIKNHLYT